MKAPVRYGFQWCKTTVGWLQRATWKKRYRARLKKIVILKSKKCFSLRKLTKMSNLILCFSEIPKIFLCSRKSGGLSEDWKKLSVWSSVLFLVFALEMRKREAYRTDGIKRVYPSQQGHDRFMQVSYTVSWILQILSAIINVVD